MPDPISNELYISRHVVFYEQLFPTKDDALSSLKTCKHLPSSIGSFPNSDLSPAILTSLSSLVSLISHSREIVFFQSHLYNTTSSVIINFSQHTPSATISPAPQPNPPPLHHPMVTRASADTSKPKSFPEYQLYYSTKYPIIDSIPSLFLSNPNDLNRLAKYLNGRSYNS